jgi:hypothetical protein
MKIDYSALNESVFIKNIKQYIAFKFLNFINLDDDIIDNHEEKLKTKKRQVLNTTDWLYFKLGIDNLKTRNGIFTIDLGKPIHAVEIEENNNISLSENWIPYVTRTKENNGTEFFVDIYTLYENMINSENCITIGAEGFKAFYQSKKFINGNKVNILKNENINKYNALFICAVLNIELEMKFNYGRGATKERLKRLKIKLPVTKDGQPDWQFMEDYIKSLPYSKEI